MSNIYNHGRPMVPPALTNRLSELLDAIKNEFDSITQEASVFKMHKDDYEHKISAQIQEMQSVRQTVYELELTHKKIKQQYEDEITRLRRELEARSGQAPMPQQAAPQQQQVPPQHAAPMNQQTPAPQQPGQPAPPAIGQGPSNLFGGIMSGQGSLAAPEQQQQQQGQQGQGGYPGYPNGQQQQPPTKRPRTDAEPYTPGPGGPNAQYPGSVKSAYPPNSNAPAVESPGAQHATPVPKRPKNNGPAGPVTATPQSQATGIAPIVPSPHVGGDAALVKQDRAGSVPPMGAAPPHVPMGDHDSEDDLPRGLKKKGEDWYVVYNPKAPKNLEVNLLHSLEHMSVVCCVRFSADGKYLATGCNRSAQIYEVKTGKRVCVLKDEAADREGDLYIRSVCFSPNGKLLATGAEDRQIRIWDIKNKKIVHLLTGHEQDIYSLDFSRDGRYVASGSGDRTARVWDLETGQCILTLSIEDGVTTVAISPDGRYVAAGSLDKIVRVWDSQTGYLLERLEGHKDSVYSVAFSPDGKDLLSGSLDKTIKLWELNSPRGLPTGRDAKGGNCKLTFSGHKDFVLSVCLSPDGRWVVSGSKDRCVEFWDPRDGTPQLMLQGHKNSVISVAISPNGKLFATGSGDMRAKIWTMQA
ncbi:proteinral transcription repressor [Saitoella coloradoensis]